ncbi:MAG: M56 family metallopeptidase [Inhella sp.]
MTSFLLFYGTPLPLLFCLAIVLMALLRPLARAIGGPQGQYWAWCAVPLCLLAAALPAPPVSMAAATPAAVRAVEQVKSQARSVLQLTPQASRSTTATASPRPLQIAVAAYGFGALLLCTAFALQHRRWARQLGWDAARKRWTLPAGFSPAVVWLWHLRLALPLDFEQRFTATEQQLILAHEQVHAQRRDTLWNLLATLLLVLNWFNPLAWWALRRFQRDQELACDASALAALGASARQPYWDALLKAHALSPSSALAHGWRSAHPLIERLRWVKQGVNRRSRVLLASAPLLAAVPAFAVYATHGAAVQGMGAPEAAMAGEVRVWLRSQIDGGTWVEDWVDLNPSSSPVAQSTQTLNGKAMYSDVIHIRRAEDGSLAGWIVLKDPGSPTRPHQPGPPDPDELGGQVTPLQLGAWQATEFKTRDGHRVRLEFKLTAAEPKSRHN